MLLDITPNGNEIQRKLLLNHSSKINIAFSLSLILIPIAIFVGKYYSPHKSSTSSGEYIIESIIRGNTIVLENGAQVELLGIAPDYRETTAELICYEGSSVIVIPDSSDPFEEEELKHNHKLYGYVSLSDETLCLNSELLKAGKAKLVMTPNLCDSLDVYKAYANMAGSDSLTEERSVLDYYSELNFDPTQYQLSNEPIPVRWSTNGYDNLAILEKACTIDECTKNFANQLAARSAGPFNMGQICEIFNYCYKNWKYVNDPSGAEYLASASQSIASHLIGDCDDFAVLMASCVMAIGGNSSVILAYKENSGHAYAEVEISSMAYTNVQETIEKYYPSVDVGNLNVRSDSNGRLWLNLDWSANHPGGDYWGDSHVIHTCVNSQWSAE